MLFILPRSEFTYQEEHVTYPHTDFLSRYFCLKGNKSFLDSGWWAKSFIPEPKMSTTSCSLSRRKVGYWHWLRSFLLKLFSLECYCLIMFTLYIKKFNNATAYVRFWLTRRQMRYRFSARTIIFQSIMFQLSEGTINFCSFVQHLRENFSKKHKTKLLFI